MKTTLLSLALLLSAYAFAGNEYSVTGRSHKRYHIDGRYGVTCMEAEYDARNAAERKCLQMGGTGFWFGGKFSECKERLITAGSQITLKFYCGI